ncbi:MAG: cytidine deaminase [Isosphaeraceae bacterium]
MRTGMISAEDRERLRQEAQAASARAYCPYSAFRVGAAILTGEGAVVSGCNVENASYGLTICAERNAIFRAIASADRDAPLRIVAVAIHTPTPTPTAPCGACRQVINEFGPEAEVYSFCEGPEVLQSTLAELLPHAFGPSNLE